ncbi:MAG: hypothetical protein L0K86_22465, partial [Actinomycetia bacterium]|nr:hypothetical protein [Actinomycetes bacterium]
MRFSTRSLASVILACLLLAVGLLACAGPTDRGAGSGAGSGTQDGGGAGSGPQDGGGAGSGPQDGGGDAAAVYQVVVQQDGMTLERFDLTELQDLPQVEIVTPQSRGAQIQNGPTVRDVLD